MSNTEKANIQHPQPVEDSPVAILGEGPCWHEREHKLYWVDILSPCLHRFDPTTNIHDSWEMPERVGTVAPASEGRMLVALESGIAFFHPDTHQLDRMPDMDPRSNTRFNDGKCDPQGRFWVGSMDLDEAEPIGDLYCVDTDGHHRAMGFAVTVSNGMTWDRACRRMFYIDSPTREIREFPFDSTTGELGNSRVVRKFNTVHGYPDGMTIDAEDKLWVAFWDGAAVRRIDPETGEILSEIAMVAKRPTSCCFGGEDLRDLYISSAAIDLGSDDLERYPMSGTLMKVRTEVGGFPAFEYGG